MEQIDIKGNLTVTAKIKSQIDDSPIALPPPAEIRNENLNPITNEQDNFFNSFQNNTALLKEFGNVTTDIIQNFKDLNNILLQTNKDGSTQKAAKDSFFETPEKADDSEIIAAKPIVEKTNEIEKTVEIEKTDKNESNVIPVSGVIDSSIGTQNINNPLVASSPENTENVNLLNEAQSDSTELLKDNTVVLKEFGDMMPELLKNFQKMNDLVSHTNQNLPAVGKIITSEEAKKQRIDDDVKKGFLDSLNTGNNMLSNWANGNGMGATQSFLSGVQNAANTGRDMAKAADNQDMLGLLTKVGIGAIIAGAVVKGVDTLATKFVEQMPTIYSTGKAFGTTRDDESLALWHRFNQYNSGTGLSVENFQDIIQQIRKQGVGNGLSEAENIALSGNIAQTTGRWAYATGGDAYQYAELAGMMDRYGGSKNVAKDFNYLVAAGKASGLNDTQIPEFLSAIQKSMEDGISKGFSRSATEVADTLLMFSKLSGNNAFWQGEKGAKLLNQANSGIAGATALGKTEDLLVYAAMEKAYTPERMKKILGDSKKGGSYIEGGGYINTMQMIERGIDTENFDDIMNMLNSSYNDKKDRIEALRKMTGLNYSGASRMYELGEKNLSGRALKLELDKIKDAPENKNLETRNQDNLNRIKDTVVDIGKNLANLKIAGMEDISKVVHNIYDFLTGEGPEPDKDEIPTRDESLVLHGKDMPLEEAQKIGDFGRTPAQYSRVFESYHEGAIPTWTVSNDINLDDKDSLDEFLRSGFTENFSNLFDSNEEANSFLSSFIYGSGRYEDAREKYKDSVREAILTGDGDKIGKINPMEQNKLLDELKEIVKILKEPIRVVE